jgi:glycosyltransferase involved in cell wall biosynthesis
MIEATHAPTNDASDSPPRRVCVVVAGMHRAGTSATTRVVNLLGAKVSQNLVLPVIGDNDRGFWEPIRVVEIHDRLLCALDSSYDDPFPLKAGWIQTAVAQRAWRELAEEIENDFVGSDFFVVKDPRISRLLPLWLKLLDDLKIEPIIVIPFRNPLEVAASLKKRNLFSLSKSFLMYLRSALETELASRGRRRLFVCYDELLSDWGGFAKNLRRLAGEHMPCARAESMIDIKDFLTADLYRNRFTSEQLASAVDIAPTVVEVFNRLREACSTEKQSDLQNAFDSLRANVHDATQLFHGLVLEEREKARLDIAHVQREQEIARNTFVAEVATLKEQLSCAHEKITCLEATLTIESTEKVRLHDELSAVHVEINHLSSALATRSTEMTRLGEELKASHCEAAALKATLNTQSPEIARLAEELSASQSDAIALRATLTTQSVETEQLSKELSVSRHQVIDLSALLEARSTRVDQLDSELIAMGNRVADLDELATANSTQAARLRVYLADARNRVGRLEGALRSAGRALQSKSRRQRFARPFRWIGATLRDRTNRKLITTCGLLDRNWYLQSYPDVLKSGIDAARHYLHHGAMEGRNPGPLFHTDWYFRQYPDVWAAGVNPLVHYLRYGAAEGRDPNPLFDSDWYLEHNSDVAVTRINPLVHYLRFGAAEGRNPSSLFDTSWYVSTNPDIQGSNGNPLAHYLAHGTKDGRDPNQHFDIMWYRSRYLYGEDRDVDPLLHYVEVGAAMGHSPVPAFDGGGDLQKKPDVRPVSVNPIAHYSEHGKIEGHPPTFTEAQLETIDIKGDSLDHSTARFMTNLELVVNGTGPIDAVVLLPILGRGGSEKVAMSFARLLREVRADRSVLVIVTDYDLIDPDVRIPNGVFPLRLVDFLPSNDYRLKEALLFRIIQLLRPRVCHIINSEVGWNLVSSQGGRLKSLTTLFGSMFCLQHNRETGELIGFAKNFLKDAARFCSAIMSDNETFFTEVRSLFREELTNARLLTIYNPNSSVPSAPYVQSDDRESERPAILWAGRLDRQKRLEILVELAKKMYDVDFFLFGSKVTDGDVDLESLPNLRLEGPFISIAEVIANRSYDAFIHTTREEGLPNVLIEVGEIGIPVVAPAIGGIPELVTSQTGYLLSPWPNVDEYERALRSVIANREEAIRRVGNMRRIIETRHSWSAFSHAVALVPGYLGEART